MQIRTTIDQVAMWLGVIVLVGTTGTGILFALFHEGTLPPLDRDFSHEFERMAKAGDYAGALSQMKLAAELNPAQHAQMLQNRITFAWLIGDVAAQKESMRIVADSGRVTDPAAYAGFAAMLLEPRDSAQQGRPASVDAEAVEMATAYANRAVELDPNFPLGHYALGVAALFQQDEPRAAECFRKALSLDPTLVRARQRLQQLGIEPGGR